MSWVRLDDRFPEHPKVLELTRGQRWDWVCLLCYCARHRTQGFVSLGALEQFGFDSDGAIKELLGLGLLDELEDGGYVVHDWHIYNGAKSGAQRTSDWRDKKYGEARYTHGGRRGSYPHAESGSTASSVTDGDGDVTTGERHANVTTYARESPSIEVITPTSKVDIAREGEIDFSSQLLATRLLDAAGELDDARRDYIRGAVMRLPEAVGARILETVKAGGARSPAGYILGALAAELKASGL